jgi:hypothetical protein
MGGRGSVAPSAATSESGAHATTLVAESRPGPVARRRWNPAAALASLALYALLVVVLTWPLAPRATSHIPATWGVFHFDTLHTTWMLAHETHALATAPSTVLDTNIYHPERRTLFYNTTSLGFLPYFAPTFAATGNPALAIDVAFLACVALTAWTMHLVVVRWTGSELAGAVAGCTFLMSRAALWGFISIAQYFSVLQYQPLIVLAAATPGPVGLSLPLLIALQCLVDPLYVAPAVLLPLGAIVAWRFARVETRPAAIALLRAMIVAGIVLLPVYAGYVDVFARNPDLSHQSVWSAQVQSPTTSTDAWGRLVAWWTRFPIPLSVLPLVALGALSLFLRRREATPALRAAWLHAILWSVAGIALPAMWSFLPFLRGAERNGVVSLLGVGLLAGLAAAECAARLPARARPLLPLAVLGILFAWPDGILTPGPIHFLGSYPTQPAGPSDGRVMDALRASTGPVLELPAAVGPRAEARALYRSIFHRRPLVNGYSSYYPAAYPHRMQLAGRLPDPTALAALRDETGLATIVVHTREVDDATRARWDAVLHDPERFGLRTVADDDGVLVFDVVRP